MRKMNSCIVTFIILNTFKSYAGFSELNEKSMYQYTFSKKTKVKVSKQKKVINRRIVKSHKKQLLLKELLKQDRTIVNLLNRSEKKLIVRKQIEKVRSFSRFKAILLESIIATNRKPTSFLVKLKANNTFLSGAEIQCQGMSFNKRITNRCHLLVLPENGREFKVNVVVKDLDGAEGIIADEYYTGEEKNFLTSSLSQFFSGVIDATRDRILTPFGEVNKINTKNKVLGGLMNVANSVNTNLSNLGEKNLNISFVNAGKEIFVFFNREISLNSQEKQ